MLGNPHYHQSHDVLETINHQLVTEVAKTTAATLMLLASSPSRLAEPEGGQLHQHGTATLSWTAGPEKGVTGYIVAWGPAGEAGGAAGPRDQSRQRSIKVDAGHGRLGEGRQRKRPRGLGLGAGGA